MTTPFGKSQKDEAFAHDMFKRVSTCRRGRRWNHGHKNAFLVRLGLLLKSDTPATIAEIGSVTSEDEWRPLSGGTGERQQQIVGALGTGA